jgi:hypothetical protein
MCPNVPRLTHIFYSHRRADQRARHLRTAVHPSSSSSQKQKAKAFGFPNEPTQAGTELHRAPLPDPHCKYKTRHKHNSPFNHKYTSCRPNHHYYLSDQRSSFHPPSSSSSWPRLHPEPPSAFNSPGLSRPRGIRFLPSLSKVSSPYGVMDELRCRRLSHHLPHNVASRTRTATSR